MKKRLWGYLYFGSHDFTQNENEPMTSHENKPMTSHENKPMTSHENKKMLTTQENRLGGHDIYDENNSKIAYTTQVLEDTLHLYDNNGKHIGTV